MTGRLLSVNVGLPKEIVWRGQTVRTSIWKSPVEGKRMVRRLNIDGDAQADLKSHGGEHRAVFVYQIDSYKYWQDQLDRADFTLGQFGENFTVEGLPDTEVCVGDRYRVGSALFEVTQPRVTCYRVGIRMNEPRMPNLLAYVRYSRPLPDDKPGLHFDAPGRLDMVALDGLGVSREADFYLCGPAAFLRDFTAGLASWGVASDRVYTEIFGAGESETVGIVAAPVRSPHPPPGAPGKGPRVSFARSKLEVPWDPAFHSLLEFAEACDVPVRWVCRSGVCHSCERALIAGAVDYEPSPLEPAAKGNLLICCSRPRGDVVIDL